MWFVVECCGLACVVITYLTVIIVQIGVVRVGIWDDLLAGEKGAYIHFAIFMYHCFMIFASHFKCMTSEPGILPKNVEKLKLSLMHEQVQKLYKEVSTFAVKVKEEDEKMKQEIFDSSSEFSDGEEEPDSEEEQEKQKLRAKKKAMKA